MTKRVCDMTPEEYRAYDTEKDRIKRLAYDDPDKLTVDDLENLQDGDEAWTELALSIACSRLRAMGGAAIALVNAVCENQRILDKLIKKP